MVASALTYVTGKTVVHRLDARMKVALLLAFSIGVFVVKSWCGLGILSVACAVFAIVARLPPSVVNRLCTPVYVLAGFSVLFNVMASPSVAGLSAGLFFALRMIVLTVASFVLCLTTTSSQLLDAFRSLVAPLSALHLPVDDIALTLSLSVRFIPVIEQEFYQIRSAQLARGGQATGSLLRALGVWGSAFSSLFVGLFRRADNLASAMDARCYGASHVRTRISK